ncbi:helix-turn-helix protein [Ruminococcaceae bacterium R-25]|nr:helix-turn-helix protein [Ruminococcaceae bacterium R-25]SUQ11008.1 Helix-turn-helix [Oscillospiraceae bacterium]
MKKSERAIRNDYLPVASVFGRNIKSFRNIDGSSIRDFSKKIRYDRNRLSDLEEGFQNIRLSTAIRIAKAIDVRLDLLFDKSFIDDHERFLHEHFINLDYLSLFISNVEKKIKNSSLKKTNTFSHTEKAFRILGHKVSDPMIGSLGEMAEELNVPLSELLKEKNS